MFDKHKIAAILTAWKRDYFPELIDSLLKQTMPPEIIVIFNNGREDLTYLKKMFKDTKIYLINSDYNTKYWGRFAMSYLVNSEYILLVDDDTIPAPKWIENCYRLCNEKNCIVTGNGRSIRNDESYGDGGYVAEDMQIAFGGHSWFFKKEWLKYYISESPISYETGEDISFCASLKINGGIETWLPKQGGDTSAHMRSYSGDGNQSYDLYNWSEKRLEICEHYIKLGWSL